MSLVFSQKYKTNIMQRYQNDKRLSNPCFNGLITFAFLEEIVLLLY